ncbi:uncharacterized protein LOC114716409 [Neltuma alba]|uniref:uncharacterized protein LOC114716409 n=1 Tax=Neltuma alba TaxID=207710 RepID=UPI0010A2CD38|nr:uncharacterized protein LOC114716409 [Prosopis alba]
MAESERMVESEHTDGGEGTDDGEKAKRTRKKVKHPPLADTDGKEKDEPTQETSKSFKATLLGTSSDQVSRDRKGASVFDEAWAEYIDGLQGYFSKENMDGVRDDTEDVDTDDDEDCPTLKVSRADYERWCAPWRKSLIVKLLGKSVLLWVMKNSLKWMWKTTKAFTTRDIDNGYFVVSFEDEEDLNRIYQEGPWMVSNRYLVVQRWRPNFDPWSADLQKKIAVWIRIPLLPLEFFNAESLKMIGSLIGRALKIDRVTYGSERGKYARICVEIDIKKRLKSAVNIFGRCRCVEYEGLHLICFCCGKYGHHKDSCPEKTTN